MIRNASTALLNSWVQTKEGYGVRDMPTWRLCLCTFCLHNPVRSWFLPNQIEFTSHEVCAKTPLAQLPDTTPDAVIRVLFPRDGSSDTRSRQSIYDRVFFGLLSSLAAVPSPSVRNFQTAVLGSGENQHLQAHSDSGLLLLSSRHEESYYQLYRESLRPIPSSVTKLNLEDMESGRIAKNRKPPVQIVQLYLQSLIMLLACLLILFLARRNSIHIISDGPRDCKWGC
jgi:hypothetical protein